MTKIKHPIPFIGGEDLIVAAKYSYRSTNMLTLLLQFAMKTQKEELSYIPYNMFETFGAELKKQCNFLFDVSFPVYDENGNTGKLHWIDQIFFDDENRRLIYQLSKPIKDNLDYLSEKYPEDAQQLIKLVRPYSFRVYQFLYEKYKKRNDTLVSFSEFRKICGIPDDYYPSFTELKRTIVCKIVNDLQKELGWEITFLPVSSTQIKFVFEV